MRRTIAALSFVVACVVSACIIGPKQDDPANENALMDAGVIFGDTGRGGSPDAAAADDTAPPAPHDNDAASDATASDTSAADALVDGDADAGDAADAVADGSDAAEGG